jgi:hypothetical protein
MQATSRLRVAAPRRYLQHTGGKEKEGEKREKKTEEDRRRDRRQKRGRGERGEWGDGSGRVRKLKSVA